MAYGAILGQTQSKNFEWFNNMGWEYIGRISKSITFENVLVQNPENNYTYYFIGYILPIASNNFNSMGTSFCIGIDYVAGQSISNKSIYISYNSDTAANFREGAYISMLQANQVDNFVIYSNLMKLVPSLTNLYFDIQIYRSPIV